MPVPTVRHTFILLSLPTPEILSASPAQFTSFSTSQGIPNADSNSVFNEIPAYSGTASDAYTIVPVSGSTIPVVEIQIPSSAFFSLYSTISSFACASTAGPPCSAWVGTFPFTRNRPPDVRIPYFRNVPPMSRQIYRFIIFFSYSQQPMASSIICAASFAIS